MSCKCDKDKFREEFIKEIEKLKDETVGLNVVATFNELWKEHMED